MEVAELLALASKRAGVPDPTLRRELRWLLARQLKRSEAWVLAHSGVPVDKSTVNSFLDLAQRRAAGEPFAYLVGEREFYGRTFACDPRGLIPRPETELLIEQALSLDLPREAHILDIGTGTGCIAATLLCERPGWSATATDLSIGALALARANAEALGVADRLRLVASDLMCALEELESRSFDLIVSNPPYVPLADAARLAPDVRDHEPHLALFGEQIRSDSTADSGAGESGLGVYRRLFPLVARQPAPILFEIGFGQLAALQHLADSVGLHIETTLEDLAGIPRVIQLSAKPATGGAQ
jgi:release factor glutamine methyltransferase